MKLSILGCGNWGSVFAIIQRRNGHNVKIWEFERERAEHLQKTRNNEPFIVGLPIDPRNTVTRADIAGVAFQVAWANGVTIDSVTIARSGSPVAESISVTEGEKFKAGTIAYL